VMGHQLRVRFLLYGLIRTGGFVIGPAGNREPQTYRVLDRAVTRTCNAIYYIALFNRQGIRPAFVVKTWGCPHDQRPCDDDWDSSHSRLNPYAAGHRLAPSTIARHTLEGTTRDGTPWTRRGLTSRSHTTHRVAGFVRPAVDSWSARPSRTRSP
jgi:hypothetical protein